MHLWDFVLVLEFANSNAAKFFKFVLPAISSSSGSNNAALGVLGVMGGFYSLVLAFYCLMILVGVASFIIWIWMLLDCIQRKNFEKDNDRLLWALVIIFSGIVGAVIYYFLIKRKMDVPSKPAEKKNR